MTTKAARNDLTEYATKGYQGDDNKHIFSSPCFYAHALGEHLQKTGRTAPQDVRMSRGYSIRCGDMLFSIQHSNGVAIFTRER